MLFIFNVPINEWIPVTMRHEGENIMETEKLRNIFYQTLAWNNEIWRLRKKKNIPCSTQNWIIFNCFSLGLLLRWEFI